MNSGATAVRRLTSAAWNFVHDETGASMVEYGLMVALIAAACVVAVTALGTALSGQFTTVSGNI
jgi:pilus assembly protein Flp/PilA